MCARWGGRTVWAACTRVFCVRSVQPGVVFWVHAVSLCKRKHKYCMMYNYPICPSLDRFAFSKQALGTDEAAQGPFPDFAVSCGSFASYKKSFHSAACLGHLLRAKRTPMSVSSRLSHVIPSDSLSWSCKTLLTGDSITPMRLAPLVPKQ